jgi:histone deacetylase 6
MLHISQNSLLMFIVRPWIHCSSNPYTASLHIPKVDGTQSYVHWAISQNFGVIDVNIPEQITIGPGHSTKSSIDNQALKPEDFTNLSGHASNSNFSTTSIEYASTTTDAARREGEKLASYLWENYVEPYSFPHGIILIGAGHAFHAVAKLVSDNDNVHQHLLGIVCFISTQPVRPVSSGTNHWISVWYRENSLVFISEKHSLWKKEKEGGKVSKRYGKLLRGQGEILGELMTRHRDEVVGWIDARVAERKEAVRDAESDEAESAEEDIKLEAQAGGKSARVSDADTIDDPSLMGEPGNDAGKPVEAAAFGSSFSPQASLHRSDVVMTTEH